MGMYKVISLVRAEAVIAEAMVMINSNENMPAALPEGKEEGFRIAVESYQNGREQGLIAWPMFNPAVAYYICEARGTDQICIYRGDYALRTISDDAYKHPNYHDDTSSAAEWLVTDLVETYIVKLERDKK